MEHDANPTATFVIKPWELPSLNYVAADHPRPLYVEWINRGTDQKLRPSSVEMLLRTLFHDMASPSVVRLHRSAGLRVAFRSDKDRDLFAAAFSAARARESAGKRYHVTAMFVDRKYAEQAVEALKNAGIADSAISLLWRAGQFLEPGITSREGHSKLSVAGAVAGSGVAGAMFGVAMIAIPGVGPVAAAGAVAAAAYSSIAAVGGALGATGGAIAKMLTDHDVDGVSAAYCDAQARRGKIFVSVDTRLADDQREIAREILRQHGGRAWSRAFNAAAGADTLRVVN